MSKVRKSVVIALAAAVGTMGLLLSASPALATTTCDGSSCYGLDPTTTFSSIDGQRCDTGATTPGSVSTSLGLVELRYGPHCHANWAKTSGSSAGTSFWVQNTDNQVQFFSVPSGSTSAFGNMVNGYPQARAGNSAGFTGWF